MPNMRTLLCFILLSSVFKDFAIAGNETPSETPESDSSNPKLCNGPGSDPFRNLAFNGSCNCKRNVRGVYCTDCKKHSFDLNGKHQYGCLRCFCSGLSRNCTSSGFFRSKIQLTASENTDKVSLVYKNLTTVQLPHSVTPDWGVSIDNLPAEFNETYYWKLPDSFTGDRLTAYAGYLNFTIDYESYPEAEKKWLKDPLAVIAGRKGTIYFRFRKRNRRIASHVLPVVENVWHTVRRNSVGAFGVSPKGGVLRKPEKPRKGPKKAKKRRKKRARRRQLMAVLMDVDYILVKANYRASAKKVSLLETSLSHVSDSQSDSDERASEVEKCQCPEGYGGLSCQQCSSGFTQNPPSVGDGVRKKSTRKRKECFPCNCNGHSELCDAENGKCKDCKHNTAGDFCQHSLLHCDRRGTFKHIMLPSIPSKCVCKAGVHGKLCDTCKSGYFDLSVFNHKGCRRCWCSGVTLNCVSSSLRRFKLRIQPPAFINMGFSDGKKIRLWAMKVNNGKAVFPFNHYANFHGYHWALPKKFTGNLLRSYGGSLNFTMYHHGICDHKTEIDPFLQLESFSGDIIAWKFSPQAIINAPVHFSVRFTEEHFMYYGLNAERNMFLRILSSLKALKVFVPQCRGLKSTEISNIVMDTAVNWASELPVASEVEQCRCPHAYAGLSCENCSRGYVKDYSGRRCVRKSSYNYLHGA